MAVRRLPVGWSWRSLLQLQGDLVLPRARQLQGQVVAVESAAVLVRAWGIVWLRHVRFAALGAARLPAWCFVALVLQVLLESLLPPVPVLLPSEPAQPEPDQ